MTQFNTSYSPLKVLLNFGGVAKAFAAMPVLTKRGALVGFQAGGMKLKSHAVLGFVTEVKDRKPPKFFHEKFYSWQDAKAEEEQRMLAADKAWLAPGVFIQHEEDDTLQPKGHGFTLRRIEEMMPDKTDGGDWVSRYVGDSWNWNPTAWDIAGSLKLPSPIAPMKRQTWDIPFPNLISAILCTRYRVAGMMNLFQKGWNRKWLAKQLILAEETGKTHPEIYRKDWVHHAQEAAYRLVLKMEDGAIPGFDFKAWLAYTGGRTIKYSGLWGKADGMTPELCDVLHTAVTALLHGIYRRRAELFSPVHEEKKQLQLAYVDDYLTRIAERILISDKVAASRAGAAA